MERHTAPETVRYTDADQRRFCILFMELIESRSWPRFDYERSTMPGSRR